MSKVGLKTRRPALRQAAVLPVVTMLAASLLAGCVDRNSVTVGAIPDDYRTNHPIVISEQERALDLPVSSSAHAISHAQKTALTGFFDGYERSNGSPVFLLVPVGSSNAAAASYVSGDFIRLLTRIGVPQSRISVQSYSADSPGPAPIRVTYSAVRANAGPCGRWPKDILATPENKHYADFGCSYQRNLAAQVANPTDLLGPRKPAPIDPENRANAIGQYKARGVAGDFNSNSEVDY